MDDLWTRNDRPIPASYWVAAGLGSLVVLITYATAWWVPWFVANWADGLPRPVYVYGTVLLVVLGLAFGIPLAAAPWVALRWPLPALGLAVLPVVPAVVGSSPFHFGVFATLCAVVVTAGWRDARMALAAAGVAVVAVVVWVLAEWQMAAPFRAIVDLRVMDHEHRMGTLLLYLLAVVLVVLSAWWLRRSSERELERRALAARAGDVEQQSAVVAERARLARDLHDVVAHHVSLIAVRAETAPYTHPAIGEEARGVLGDIAADARLALDELRGVLGILGRSGGPERAPQPTWSDISALVERTRSAGVEVELVGDPAVEVAPGAGYTAYRVVQEALTNARKHAPGARVVVDLEATSQLLTVTVSTALPDGARPASGGQGLVGMRERVEALGGRLLAGPVNDEFVVEAILPRSVPVGVA